MHIKDTLLMYLSIQIGTYFEKYLKYLPMISNTQYNKLVTN